MPLRVIARDPSAEIATTNFNLEIKNSGKDSGGGQNTGEIVGIALGSLAALIALIGVPAAIIPVYKFFCKKKSTASGNNIPLNNLTSSNTTNTTAATTTPTTTTTTATNISKVGTKPAVTV
jgi:hypothetical protein